VLGVVETLDFFLFVDPHADGELDRIEDHEGEGEREGAHGDGADDLGRNAGAAEETDRDERQRRVFDDFFATKKSDGRERSVSVREGVQRLCVLLVSFIFVSDDCFFSLSFPKERERETISFFPIICSCR